MKFSGDNVARCLKAGYAAAAFTSPYDGVSAVEVDPDGMVRSVLPAGGHDVGLVIEVGGRAHNLLFPYEGNHLCAHGLVRREQAGHWQPHTSCPCGQAPINRNQVREG